MTNKLTRCMFSLFMLLFISHAMAFNSNIDGTWRLISATKVALKDGRIEYPYGLHPQGYLMYLPNGYMSVIIINKDLTKTLDASSMLSYAGTYTITKDKIIHHIQVAWKPNWIGSNQERYYVLRGNKLILSLYEHNINNSYKAILVWEKV